MTTFLFIQILVVKMKNAKIPMTNEYQIKNIKFKVIAISIQHINNNF